jgi:glycosyltransferase involved in cell wall biosynthesis
LLVDDGSTDASPEIAQRLARANPGQVRYLTHPQRTNRGMSASRNLGLATASGEFVGFLDADDVWLPEKLAEQIAIMEREVNAGLIYGRTLIWNSWSTVQTARNDFFYDMGVALDCLHLPPTLLEVLLLNKAQSPTTCNALMRRWLFDHVGGFEESFHGMFEDQVFFSKAFLHTPVYVADRVWAKYRQHPDSCSTISATTDRDEQARLHFLRWVRTYLKRQQITDASIWRMLRREHRRSYIAIMRKALSRVTGNRGTR